MNENKTVVSIVKIKESKLGQGNLQILFFLIFNLVLYTNLSCS